MDGGEARRRSESERQRQSRRAGMAEVAVAAAVRQIGGSAANRAKAADLLVGLDWQAGGWVHAATAAAGSRDDGEASGDLADGGRPAGGRSGGRCRTYADLVMACADQVAAGGRSGMAAEDREQSVPAAGR
ncbi:hypothetical protein Syun_006330 [Stephania yunnanensis]|uniref:Uncharacterized protein n=1 Tax=Stephania yunnanensis TaxID=152371 RepID=A0AAP0KZS9_9MAGN